MSDGSNMGITAKRALKTIIGGAPQPSEEEIQTPEQVRERVMAAPSPLEGTPIFERVDAGEINVDDAYSLATDAVAKAFLLVEQEQPGVLTKTGVWGPDNTEIQDLWGKPLEADHLAWKAISERWPGFDNWIGGASGFMVGFAFNTARMLCELPIAPNPAIVTVTDKNEE